MIVDRSDFLRRYLLDFLTSLDLRRFGSDYL